MSHRANYKWHSYVGNPGITLVRGWLHRVVRPFIHSLADLLPMIDEFTTDLRRKTVSAEADFYAFAGR